MRTRNKHILLLFLDLIIYSVLLYSAQIAAFSHHGGTGSDHHCSICALSDHFVADGEVVSGSEIRLFLCCLLPVNKTKPGFTGSFQLATGTRAPPFS